MEFGAAVGEELAGSVPVAGSVLIAVGVPETGAVVGLRPVNAGEVAGECADVDSDGEVGFGDVVLGRGIAVSNGSGGDDDATAAVVATTAALLAAAAAREWAAALVMAAVARRSVPVMPTAGLEWPWWSMSAIARARVRELRLAVEPVRMRAIWPGRVSRVIQEVESVAALQQRRMGDDGGPGVGLRVGGGGHDDDGADDMGSSSEQFVAIWATAHSGWCGPAATCSVWVVEWLITVVRTSSVSRLGVHGCPPALHGSRGSSLSSYRRRLCADLCASQFELW